MFVEELKRDLNDTELAVWERRSQFTREKEEEYRQLWIRLANGLPAEGVKENPVPCVYLGDDTGKKVACSTCDPNRKVQLTVFACEIYGECTIGKKVKDRGCCNQCTSKRTVRPPAAPITSIAVLAPDTLGFIAKIPPFPEGRYSGRGITIAAGGKYWASAYVTCRMIRHVGCTLPIQIWYLGDSGERDERYERLLVPFDVECIDIDAHPNRISRRGVAGFQTKLFAAVHSPFEEVLSLDPDSYPCTDPTVLFDEPRYKQLGGIYWPDGPQTESWTNWDFWGCKKRGPCGLETGQYVLHKRLAWEPMILSEWYDDHPEWCYGGMDGVGGGDYGDKGPPRAAWAMLERDYVVFNPNVRWDSFAFVQPGPDGWSPMFIHRSRSKFMAEGRIVFSTTTQSGVNMRANLPGEEAAFGFLEELQKQLK